MFIGMAGVVCLELTPPGSTGSGGAVLLLWHPMQSIVVTSAGVFGFEWQLVQAATPLRCTSVAVVGKFWV